MSKKRIKEVQSFYIYKLKTSDIVKNAVVEEGEVVYRVELNYSQALKNGQLVALGDNQVMMKLRELVGSDYSPKKLRELEKEKEELMNSPNDINSTNRLKQVKLAINSMLFVPELITVRCETKKDYKDITASHFYLNGEEFVRFACGSGQTRRNSPTFIMKKHFDKIQKSLLCGLDDRIDKINVAKFNAYFGLYLSSMNRIPTPRFCVVSDCKVVLPNEKLLWIDSVDNQHYVSEVEKDLTMNTHDGMGLVSPDFCEKMREKTRLDWDVCNWVIRGPFIKGLVVPFDFKKFIVSRGASSVITDIWGNEVDLNDVDMIFTESQVKMWKYYKSYQDYVEQIEKNNLHFGTCRYNKRTDAEYSLLNYQYIQTLEMGREDINSLVEPTLDNFRKICEGNLVHTLCFLLGVKGAEDLDMNNIINSANVNYAKAILYNPEVLSDPYIKNRIYLLLEKQIQKAKLGRVYVRGNYQTMIADPVALMEHILGLEVKGVLKRGEIYSKWWLDRGVEKVDACRSPMVCQEEHNVVQVVNPFKSCYDCSPDSWFNDDTEEESANKEEDWFKYISSGVIYNIWDCSTIIHSDSDFDGDIVFTTDNPIIINHVVPGILPISYDKVTVPKQKFSQKQLVKADLRGFNAKIGSITNNSSCMFAMLPMFKGDAERENIIKERIRILRKLIGNSIDAAKGVEYIPFPVEWKKESKILDSDTEEEKVLKRRKNSMRIKKKPYYFIYIYDKLKKQYMQYRKNNDYVCQIKFGCKIQQLIEKENKTDEEIKFLTRYNYFSPVLNTSCIMNMLCKRVEELDFNLKYDKKGDSNFDYHLYMKNDPCNAVIYQQVENIMKALNRSYSSVASRLREDGDEARRYGGTIGSGCRVALQFLFDDAFRQIMEIINNKSFMADYVIDIAYKKKSAGLLKTFAWNMFGKDILKNLGENKKSILVPVVDELGQGEDIFGTNIKLKEVRRETGDKNEEEDDYEDLLEDDDFFKAFENLDLEGEELDGNLE